MILRHSAPQPQRSLAAVPAGSTAEIRSIVFGGIRQALAEAGVHEGDLVVCRPVAGNRVQLENHAGELVEIEEGWARFIEVEAPESRGLQTNGAGGGRPVARQLDALDSTPPDRDGPALYPARRRGRVRRAKWSQNPGELTPPRTAT